MPTFGWYLMGVAAAVFVLMTIVAFTIQIADTSNSQKAPFKIIRIASFFGMLAAGLVLLLVFLGLPDVNKGEPATSLEPGVYYIVSVDDGLTNKGEEPTHLYLVLAESEDDDSISYRFILLPRNGVDESQQSLRAEAIYAVMKVTTCYSDDICETFYHFEELFK